MTEPLTHLIYGELIAWYRLLDPTTDHADEAEAYRAAFERVVTPRPETLLELGAGAGNNAAYLKRRFRCTLADVSEAMLALSRDLNPECEHVTGDMRTLRLDRGFDAVLIHDAIVYMLSEADLLAAARTAFAHTRPGGAAIFAPDYVGETLREQSVLLGADDGARSLRCIEWTWDPDPGDHTYLTEYALLCRDGDEVRAYHDRHVEAAFARATWERILAAAGFAVTTLAFPGEHGMGEHVFMGTRPMVS